MYLSCCTWVLTGPAQETLTDLSGLGFAWIDVRPALLADKSAMALAAQLQMTVSSLAASFGLPAGIGLASEALASRRAALDGVRQAVSLASAAAVSMAYLVPDRAEDRDALARYGASLTEVADFAADQGVSVCIEHFPGTLLPTATATLSFLREIDHPNLYLLLDSGHLQISDEEPAAVIADAGPLLGYVHLDDNDGKGDLHWSLLDGIMTQEALGRTFAALSDVGYHGAVSLELSPELAQPLDALARSRRVVLEIAAPYLA